MSDPLRLRELVLREDFEGMRLTGDVLGSAQGDAPSVSARRATAAMLGVYAATSAFALSATATATGATSSAAGATAGAASAGLAAAPLAGVPAAGAAASLAGAPLVASAGGAGGAGAGAGVGAGALSVATKAAAVSLWVKSSIAVAVVAGGASYAAVHSEAWQTPVEPIQVHAAPVATGAALVVGPKASARAAPTLADLSLVPAGDAEESGNLVHAGGASAQGVGISPESLPRAPEPPGFRASAILQTATAASAASAASAALPVPSQASLREEAAEIEQVRLAVATDPNAALAHVRAYRAAHPQGSFAPEAQILEVDALVAAGQPEQAAREAERYLQNYPSGPAAARFRTLLESKE
jgi:hypothetical protein